MRLIVERCLCPPRTSHAPLLSSSPLPLSPLSPLTSLPAALRPPPSPLPATRPRLPSPARSSRTLSPVPPSSAHASAAPSSTASCGCFSSGGSPTSWCDTAIEPGLACRRRACRRHACRTVVLPQACLPQTCDLLAAMAPHPSADATRRIRSSHPHVSAGVVHSYLHLGRLRHRLLLHVAHAGGDEGLASLRLCRHPLHAASRLLVLW